jgi:hypothetical protein
MTYLLDQRRGRPPTIRSQRVTYETVRLTKGNMSAFSVTRNRHEMGGFPAANLVGLTSTHNMSPIANVAEHEQGLTVQ